MSDSSPEDFMQQALALITELKKALEASFEEQNTRINESFDAQDTRINRLFATQDTRIDNIANDFTSLNNDFQKHTQNSHASKSYVTNAITTHAQSHKQELQDAGFISVATYQAKIQEFEGRIAKLEEQIKQPTTLSEEGKGAPKVIALSIPESRDGHSGINKQPQEKPGETAPSDDSGENNTTREDSTSSDRDNSSENEAGSQIPAGVTPHNDADSQSKTPAPKLAKDKLDVDFAEADPHPDGLHTEILKAILEREAYQSINSTKRGWILTRANTFVGPSVNDNNVLHMQVILALHTLKNKLKNKSIKKNVQNELIALYNGCYNDDSLKLTELKNIIKEFIGENDLKVIVATFKDAVDDIKNFKSIMTSGAVEGGDYDNFKTAIQAAPTIKASHKGANK